MQKYQKSATRKSGKLTAGTVGKLLKFTFIKLSLLSIILLLTASSGYCAQPERIPSAHPESMTPATKELYLNWQELRKRQLRLLPVPKKIEFSGPPIDVADIVVVLKDNTVQGEIAANEIVSRIKSLAGYDTPVVSNAQAGKFNVIIDNNFDAFFTGKHGKQVTVVNPYSRKQAYALEPVADGIKLTGASPVGMMYAAVTLRWLIEKQNGETFLHPATVIDWPDIPRRAIRGFVGSDIKRYLKRRGWSIKMFYDWAFRLKINMLHRPFISTYQISPFPLDNEQWLEEDRWVKRMVPHFEEGRMIGKYLADRDIRGLDGNFLYLGTVREHSHLPETRGLGTVNVTGGPKFYSWGRKDLHRSKAEKLALFAKNAGITDLIMHGIDTNQFCDPESWSGRDDLTRELYGDCRVAATLGVYQVYYEVFKEHGINLILVLLPYYPDLFDREIWMPKRRMKQTPANIARFEKITKGLAEYLKQVSKKLPAGIPICLREAGHANTMNFYRLISGQPAYVYFEASSNPALLRSRFLPPTIVNIGEMYDPQRKQEDIFWWISGAGFQSNVTMAEFSWNTEFPGHTEFKPIKQRFALNVYDPAMRDIIAERAAVGLWGDEHGQILKNMMNNDLGLFQPFLDRSSPRWPQLPDYLRFLKANKGFLEQADKALSKAWAKGKPQFMEPEPINEFMWEYIEMLRNVVKMGIASTPVRIAIEEVKKEIRQGQRDEAVKIIDAALAQLPLAKERFQKDAAWLKADARFAYLDGGIRTAIRAGIFKEDYFAVMQAELEALKTDMDALLRITYAPRWYRIKMWERELQIAQNPQAPVIDGKLNDRVWSDAAVIEHFSEINTRIPTPRPITMKMLSDEKYIYIGGEIVQPFAREIKEIEPKQNQRRKHYRLTESIEVFLKPNPDKEEFFQYVLDIAANIYSVNILSLGDMSSVPLTQSIGATHVTDESWTFELKIPFAELNAQPGKGWKGMLAYNAVKSPTLRPKVRHYASTWLAKSFHAPDRWGEIDFTSLPRRIVPQLRMSLKSSTEYVSIPTGTGAMVRFSLSPKTNRPVFDLKITGKFVDNSGKELSAPFDIVEKKYLQAALPTINVEKLLNVIGEGIRLSITKSFHTSDNKKHTQTADFIIGEIPFTKPGETEGEMIWLSFESHTDFAFCQPFSGSPIFLSDNRASEGKSSLMIKLNASDKYGGGALITPSQKDWSPYKTMKFDIFLTGEQRLLMRWRFQSTDGKRYFPPVPLKPGWNRDLEINLEKAAEKIDLKQIEHLLLYTGKLAVATPVYLDNVRLIPINRWGYLPPGMAGGNR